MKTQILLRCGVGAVVLGFTCAQAHAAPTASDVIKRTNAVYRAMTTYQAAWRIEMQVGELGSMALAIDMRMLPGRKARIETRPLKSARGMASRSLGVLVVDDGKFAWTYLPSDNCYSRSASLATNKTLDISYMTGRLGSPAYRMLPTQRIGGRQTYVIEAVPSTLSRMSSKAQVRIYIDQATARIIKGETITSSPVRPGHTPIQMRMVMSVKNEKVNAPISPSLFRFSPPRGSREMASGMASQPFGSPGNPTPELH